MFEFGFSWKPEPNYSRLMRQIRETPTHFKIMSYVAKCTICKEALPYNRSHTSLLVQHLIEQHPDQPFKLVRAKKEKIYQDSPLENDSEIAHKAVRTSAPKSSRDIQRQLRTSLGQKADENLPTKLDFLTRHPRQRRMFYKTTGN